VALEVPESEKMVFCPWSWARLRSPAAPTGQKAMPKKTIIENQLIVKSGRFLGVAKKRMIVKKSLSRFPIPQNWPL
jgi:hypothetical protein